MNSDKRPDASTTRSVMPAMLSGGFPPVTGFSLPNGINARGLVRYQETNVSGREPRRWLPSVWLR